MKLVLLSTLLVLGFCNMNAVDFTEGLFFGLTGLRADLDECLADAEYVIADFENGVSFLHKGFSLSNIESAFKSFSYGASEI